MRVLITGGAGFIGSHLSEKLVSDGHHIVCVDNLLTGDRENIAHLEDRDSYEFIEADICDGLSANLCKDVSWIVHLASPASPIHYMKLPVETLRVGSIGTLTGLAAARKCGAGFLLASTSEVYGDPLITPQPESYWGNVNPIGVRSVYDEAKRFAEAATSAYNRTYGVATRIVRIFNTYGPRMSSNDGRAVPAFIKQALSNEPLTVFGDGSQTRSFCYVSDLVEGLCRMMSHEEEGPVNLGNAQEIPIRQLAEEIISLCDSSSTIESLPLPEDDPKMRRPDLTLANEKLSWSPVIARETGLKKTIDYFRLQQA